MHEKVHNPGVVCGGGVGGTQAYGVMLDLGLDGMVESRGVEGGGEVESFGVEGGGEVASHGVEGGGGCGVVVGMDRCQLLISRTATIVVPTTIYQLLPSAIEEDFAKI